MTTRLKEGVHNRFRPLGRVGMTIVEVLVAIFLLGLFVAGSVQLLSSTRRTADIARMNYQAINMAKDRLERVRAFPFSQLALAEESNIRLGERGAIDPNGIFQRTTHVSDVVVDYDTNPPTIIETNAVTGVKQVVVTIDLLNPRTRRFDGGRQSLESLIADFELKP